MEAEGGRLAKMNVDIQSSTGSAQSWSKMKEKSWFQDLFKVLPNHFEQKFEKLINFFKEEKRKRVEMEVEGGRLAKMNVRPTGVHWICTAMVENEGKILVSGPFFVEQRIGKIDQFFEREKRKKIEMEG